jgi:GNAT superfamily N-acetyltransferase
MTVTYAVEPWQEFKRESLVLWPRHWEEVALDRDKIKLNVDYDQYENIDAIGALHVVVARSSGRIVGYWLGVVRPHLHYADSLSAFTDVYYVDPEFRKGRVGINLFKYAEKTLRARGTKVHLDMSKVFEHLGYRKTEILFTKVLGD